MSTRATVWFHDKGKETPEAIIYRHSDGYPEGLGQDLKRFIREIDNNLKDKRFDDPSYLAAKWVVWDAMLHAALKAEYFKKYPDFSGQPHPLNFLSVGICKKDPGDIEYRYHVICDGKPTLWGEEVPYQVEGQKPEKGKKITIPNPANLNATPPAA